MSASFAVRTATLAKAFYTALSQAIRGTGKI
jgi:hypothetical protein